MIDKEADYSGSTYKRQLGAVSSGVLSQLPDREKLKKMIRLRRKKGLPKNPVRLSELGELPERFTKTLMGENFLLYDTRDLQDSDDEDEDEENRPSRILVFGTRRNLELLSRSATWFMDGTFQESPSIFVQVFSISGLVKRQKRNGEDEFVALPFVYALLPSKKEADYRRVMEALQEAAAMHRIQLEEPQRTMSDFEKSILNSISKVFPDTTVLCCFFHLGQSMYSTER